MQAITTPASSAARGHWGLKRDLPLRSTAKVGFLRYSDLDNWAHMTTFESARDDVYTLKKWQEMDLSISKDVAFTMTAENPRAFQVKLSVFDGDGDVPEKYKWRYDGPHLANMSQAELRAYIEKKVIPRRHEFYRFVAKRQAVEKLRERYIKMGRIDNESDLQAEVEELREKDVKQAVERIREKYTEMGKIHDESSLRKDAEKLLDKDVKINIQALRADVPYLDSLVSDFLDLPSMTVPYRTHPSAGLHYTRSDSHVYNDPELGPQEFGRTVPGRRLNYQSGIGSLAGVGGVAAAVKEASATQTRGIPDDRTAVSKYWLQKASINAHGRIMMEVQEVRRDRERGWDRGVRDLINGAPEDRWGPLYGRRSGQAASMRQPQSQPQLQPKQQPGDGVSSTIALLKEYEKSWTKLPSRR